MTGFPDVLPAGDIELRRWGPAHLDELMAAVEASFEQLQPWLPWAQTMPTREDEAQVLAEGERAFAAGEEFGFFMWEPDSGELVGGCGLMRRVGPGAIEIGYWVRSDRAGRGYTTAAVRALTDAAFEHLSDVQRIEIQPDRANTASTAIPRKLGYRLDREEARQPFSDQQSGISQIWIIERSSMR